MNNHFERDISYEEIEGWFESKIDILISSISRIEKERPEKNQIFDKLPVKQVLIQNISLIEKRWKSVTQEIIESCKHNINYTFLTEYPIDPNNYIYSLKENDIKDLDVIT